MTLVRNTYNKRPSINTTSIHNVCFIKDNKNNNIKINDKYNFTLRAATPKRIVSSTRICSYGEKIVAIV